MRIADTFGSPQSYGNGTELVRVSEQHVQSPTSKKDESVAGIDSIPLDELGFKGASGDLESRGMEASFTVNEVTGKAQLVIVETGTGREILKIPSDSYLYDGVLRRFSLSR